MKLLLAAVLLVSGMVALAQTELKNFERVMVSGSDYIRLAEWTESHDFHLKWVKKGEIVEVLSPSAKLEFAVDSRRCFIDGVMVWMSLPVVNRSGVPLVSVVDVETTLDPILYPKKSATRIKTICLDPGHGGKDKGKIDGRNFEKDYALLIAKEVGDLLKTNSYKVVFTRTGDDFVELTERGAIAARDGADLFVSMHYNAGSSDVRGVTVYCLTPAGMNSSDDGGGRSIHGPEVGNTQDSRNMELAWQLQKNIVKNARMEDRGMKRARFEVLRESRMPAVLIEGGFMSNPSDARNIYDKTFRKRMARAVADGIIAYARMVSNN